jgi:hypothetical protein
MLAFPASTENQVDCCSLLGQLLGNLASGDAPKAKEEPKRLVIGDATATTVTLDDLFSANEKRRKRAGGRIA